MTTLVARHISLTSCNNSNPRSLCTHPVLISFQSLITTYHLDLVLFRFLLHEFGNHYLSVSVNPSHFLLSDVIERNFTFSQSTPFQLPTLPRISLSTRPDSSKTLALYMSCTYLLPYRLLNAVAGFINNPFPNIYNCFHFKDLLEAWHNLK